MDEHRWQAGVGVQGGGHPTHIGTVTNGKQRQHSDGGVLGGVQAPRQRGGVHSCGGTHLVGNGEPERPGVEVLGGNFQWFVRQHASGPGLDALVAHHLGAHRHRTHRQLHRAEGGGAVDRLHRDVGGGARSGVLTVSGRFHHGFAVVEIKACYPPRATPVQVDGTGMHLAGCPAGVHGADQGAVGGGDAHLTAPAGTQPHANGR